ncbi:MAG: hypothetical protein HKN42_16760 [Granulosicoccus sp.]|nr:hypothetical protein [Granulosicoccus sp.]
MHCKNDRSIDESSLLGIVLMALSMVAWSTGAMAVDATVNRSVNSSVTALSVATRLSEVQRGTFDGRDYLTLHIGGHEIGPSSCRSNVLRMDTSSGSGAARQEQIETIALSAMLSATTVVVVVPLAAGQCVDGKPTFTDLYPLPVSP